MIANIGVVAHASRAPAAKALAREVGATFVSIDTGGILGCDGNHNLVQRHLAGLPGDWSVVLEDDAVPVDGFGDQLVAALEVAPTAVVSLYLGRQRPPQYQRRIEIATGLADKMGAHWLTSSRMLHAVGYAVRSDVLPALLDFDSGLPADEHIGVWASGHLGAGAVSYCWPSLVDHADWPSVTAHPDGQVRLPGRRAWRVGSRDVWSASRFVALTT